jgi:aminopeptidase S
MPDADAGGYRAPMRRMSPAAALAVLLGAACVAPLPASPSPMPTGAPSLDPSPTTASTPTPEPTAGPSPIPRLDAAAVVAAVEAAAVEAHLVALQAIADRSGGSRATGTPGYLASVRHVTEALAAAGYAPELEPFSRDGVSGTNVLAERAGIDDARVVVIGAHLDSVPVGPGINDNGSGVAVLLALAEALAGLPEPIHTIRFAFWDAEEGGPIGSAAHVAALPDQERERIVAYLNLDMVGSANPVRFVYDEAGAAPGSAELTNRFAAAFEAAGLAWDPIDLEGDSDHGPFTAAGIATGGVFSGGIEVVTPDQGARHGATAGMPSDACSHRACDTIDNVDPEVAAGMARIVAELLVGLATR